MGIVYTVVKPSSKLEVGDEIHLEFFGWITISQMYTDEEFHILPKGFKTWKHYPIDTLFDVKRGFGYND